MVEMLKIDSAKSQSCIQPRAIGELRCHWNMIGDSTSPNPIDCQEVHPFSKSKPSPLSGVEIYFRILGYKDIGSMAKRASTRIFIYSFHFPFLCSESLITLSFNPHSFPPAVPDNPTVSSHPVNVAHSKVPRPWPAPRAPQCTPTIPPFCGKLYCASLPFSSPSSV